MPWYMTLHTCAMSSTWTYCVKKTKRTSSLEGNECVGGKLESGGGVEDLINRQDTGIQCKV